MRIFLILIPLFLFSFNSTSIIKKIKKERLFNSFEWKALLHYYNGEFQIKDKNFYMDNQPSLKMEMINLIKTYKKNPKVLCKFPARIYFLHKKLHIPYNPTICKSLNIYLKKAPMEKLYLVYVSENVKYPTSIMGHTFFKIEGKDKNYKLHSHAISFYTLINSYNPLVLLYENIFSGMQGIYSLQPYNIIISNYIFKEDRNIWEYELNLDKFHKKLIYLHFWELKNIKIKYYFSSFNCSTLTYQILGIGNKNLFNLYPNYIWMTPLENVKSIYKTKLVKKANLIPSNNWYIRMLEEYLNKKEINQVLNILNKKKFNNIPKLSPIQKELLISSAILYYKKNRLLYKELIKIEKIKNNIKIDLSHYKLPQKIPPERQFSIDYMLNNNHKNYLKLSFLPASHTIYDNNKQYFTENELKLFYTSFLINKKHIILNDFTIYGIKALIPFDKIVKNLSYQAKISIEQIPNNNLKKKLFLNINGGIGISYKLKTNILFAIIPNTSLIYRKKLSLMPIISSYLSFYTKYNGKFILKYDRNYFKIKHLYEHLKITQNFFIKNFTPYLEINFYKKKNNILKNITIGYKYLF